MNTRITLAVLAVVIAAPALATVAGHSTVSNCGEAGNWIDITFTADEPVTLDTAHWNFQATDVWLDPNGSSMCPTFNEGVDSVELELIGDEGQPTQLFAISATGFDPDDAYRFAIDLDLGSGGSPFTDDYLGGELRLEFSNGLTLTAVFDTPYFEPNGARAYFEETGPNLTFVDRPGWYAPVVPRADDTAEWSTVPAPSLLVGESATTWFNAACYNDGDAQALSSSMILQLDGETICQHNLWVMPPGMYNGWVNDGGHTVRGGRHTVVAFCDADDDIAEGDETDNAYGSQWIWQPLTLGSSPLTRFAPPEATAGVEHVPGYWHNCDGVRIDMDMTHPWNAVWMEPIDEPDAFYYLRLHDVATDAEHGFGENMGSTFLDEGLDAILINGHQLPTASYDIGVLNQDGTPPYPSYRIGRVGSSPYPFDFGIFSETPYTASRLMTFDFFVGVGDLGTASLVVACNPDSGPVKVGWLGPDFTEGTLADVQDVVDTGDRGWAVVDLDLTQIGHHAAVVWADPADHPGSLSARVGLFKARPDLRPTTFTGWHAPIVPRPAGDAALFSCPEPDTLHGNGPWTWLNAVCTNGGTADADTVSFSLRLDGDALVGIRNVHQPLPPGLPRAVVNLESFVTEMPWSVPGGRHTLSYELDYLDELAELLEVNNWSGRQYCWSPQVIPIGGILTRSSVPPRDGGHADCEPGVELYPNCDGLRMQRVDFGSDWVGRWHAVAAMPSSMTRDIDLELHKPLAGTSEGFGPNRYAHSTSPAGEIEFVMTNYGFSPDWPYDVGVLDGAGNGGAGYTVQDALSNYRFTPDNGPLGPFTIPEGHMIDLHEMWLPSGPLTIRVDDLGGGADWGLSIYWGSLGGFFGKSLTLADGLADDAGPGQSETILVDVPMYAHYCVAVWKANANSLPSEAPYRLWLTYGATPAPDTPPAETRLLAASPNPFNPRTTIAYELATAVRCRLAIHDLRGRLVRTLVDGSRPAGRHEVVFDGLDDAGRSLPSGVYLARLIAGDRQDRTRLTLVR
jgi:hypothetical protein